MTGEVWRGRRADHEPYGSQTDLQQVWLCRAAAVCGCLMGELPESDLVLQLLLLSGGHLELVVNQGIDHALRLGPLFLGAIV